MEPSPVVLTGPNGAGKTNLLEAVSYLAPGRGLRGAKLSEIDRRPSAHTGWAVAATVETADGPIEIGTGRQRAEEKRLVRIAGAPAKSQAALADFVSAVWLTPRMDRLFSDGPAGRRRFLDRLVFGFDPAHAGRVSGYENAMRQRGRLLRDGAGDAVWLDVLEGTMAERGVAIAAARRDIVARLNRACAAAAGPFPKAGLSLEGAIEGWLEKEPALAVEERARKCFAEGRTRDAETGGAGIGPHRTDFLARHIETDQPAALCSTGEQKALLIAIVLADARLRAAERGAAPLLLLDEVAAHLDASRREALFEEICRLRAQVWLAGTDRATFDGLDGRAQHLAVADGAATLN